MSTASASADASKAGSEDDWLTIPQKKDKKKKKKQRPVPLQEFFGGGDDGRGGGEGDETHYIKTRFRGEGEPELSHDEEVVAASLHSYFADFLKRHGPVRLEDAKLQSEVRGLDPDAQKLVGRFPSLAAFMAASDDLAVVDNIVCARQDVRMALSMAADTVLNNAATNPTSQGSVMTLASRLKQQQISSRPSPPPSSSPLPRPPQPPPPAASPSAANAWPSSPQAQTQAKPASESLFSQQVLPSSQPARVVPPADITVPPPPLVPKSFVPVVGGSSPRSGFGTIGNVPTLAGKHPPAMDVCQMQEHIESQNKKLLALTRSNADLMQQLRMREKQIHKLNEVLNSNSGLLKENERLKLEVKQTQLELRKLKGEDEDGEAKSPSGGSGGEEDQGEITESQLIIKLQTQLECERLNSWTLKQQLDIERASASRLADWQMSLPGSGAAVVTGLGGVGLGGGVQHTAAARNNGHDSLGLRSLLGNIAPMATGGSGGSGPGTATGAMSSPLPLPPAASPAPLGATPAAPPPSSSAAVPPTLPPQPPPTSSPMLPPTSLTVSQLGGGASPAAVGDKLDLIMTEVRKSLPEVSDEELTHYLAKIKREHGQLNQLSVAKIVELVSREAKRT